METLLALVVGAVFAGIGAVIGDGWAEDGAGPRLKPRVLGATTLAVSPSLLGLLASTDNPVVAQSWLLSLLGAALGASCGAAALRNRKVGDFQLFALPACGVLLLAPLNLMGSVWLTLL